MVRRKKKSASEHRNDLTWKYNVQVNIKAGEKSYMYLKCNYCGKVIKRECD